MFLAFNLYKDVYSALNSYTKEYNHLQFSEPLSYFIQCFLLSTVRKLLTYPYSVLYGPFMHLKKLCCVCVLFCLSTFVMTCICLCYRLFCLVYLYFLFYFFLRHVLAMPLSLHTQKFQLCPTGSDVSVSTADPFPPQMRTGNSYFILNFKGFLQAQCKRDCVQLSRAQRSSIK